MPSHIPVTDGTAAIVNSPAATAVTLLKVGTVPACLGYVIISPTLTRDVKSLTLVDVTFPVEWLILKLLLSLNACFSMDRTMSPANVDTPTVLCSDLTSEKSNFLTAVIFLPTERPLISNGSFN